MSAETSSKSNIFSAAQTTESGSLDDILRAEMREGPISFARFMALALYHPNFGYYQRYERQIGRSGDFYTSVSVGSLYGELLAFQFLNWLSEMNIESPVWIECGAHDGELARDILTYLEQFRPADFKQLEYLILEPSPGRRARQEKVLQHFANKVRWVSEWEEIPTYKGICFSNELLDAMPAHILAWDAAAKSWRELGVAEANGRYDWAPLDSRRQNTEAIELAPRIPPELAAILPDGFRIETSPEAVRWWTQAARALGNGFLMAVDYGFLEADFLMPNRAGGTLRAYSKHRASGNVFSNPGDQDLTVHVNFSALIRAAEKQGLSTEPLIQQGFFIKTVVEEIEKQPEEFPLWTAMRLRQLSSLVHPEHLGRSFKVLVQKRL